MLGDLVDWSRQRLGIRSIVKELSVRLEPLKEENRPPGFVMRHQFLSLIFLVDQLAVLPSSRNCKATNDPTNTLHLPLQNICQQN